MDTEITNILQPLKRRRKLVIIISTLYILISLLPPFFIGRLIDEIYPNFGDNYTYIVYIIVIILLLMICFFLNWLKGYLKTDLINTGAGIIRSLFFKKALNKNYRYYQEYSVGDINNKIINDSYIYVQSKLMMFPTLFLNIIYIVILFGFLFYLNPYMKMMVLIFSALFFLIYKNINKHLRNSSIKERESFSNLMTEANETLTGINTIQLYGGEDYASDYFENLVEKYEHDLSRLKYWEILSKASTDTITNIIPIAAIIAGIIYLIIGGDLTVGEIIAFYYFLPRLKEPIKALTDFNIDYQNANAVKERLEKLYGENNREYKKLKQIKKINQLEFKDLGYTFPDGEVVFSGLNFNIKKGDSVAITGPSGTGKSTLMRLLLQQIIPSEGCISINGDCYSKVDHESYLSRIGVLPQEVFLFGPHIKENISFGKEYSEEHLERIIKLSKLDHICLDDNALGLSGGERQRIGLARALARDYDILILDEPTSELDKQTENDIINNLKEIQKDTNCIIIVITHSDHILKKLCTKQIKLSTKH